MTVVSGSVAAYTGRAKVVADDGIDASATSFRGNGWRVAAEVAPDRALYGDVPARPVVLRGDTAVPPDRRDDGSGRFPPDLLRQVPFWDGARLAGDDLVLVVVDDPMTVRRLAGPDDGLIGAVAAIRSWTTIAEPAARLARIRADLEAGTLDPAAWGAAAELAVDVADDPARAAADLLALARQRSGATGAVVSALPEAVAGKVVGSLLDQAADANDPADLAAFAAWFDRHRPAWEGHPALAAGVATLATRAAAAGPGDNGWGDEAARYASALSPDAR